MANLKVVEIKPFVPAKDYELAKSFYQDLGFTLAADNDGVAYFHCDRQSFLLQNFYKEELAQNLMLSIVVEDVEAWYHQVKPVAIKYGVHVSVPENQPWRMRDFVVIYPSGVLWRIGQHLN